MIAVRHLLPARSDENAIVAVRLSTTRPGTTVGADALSVAEHQECMVESVDLEATLRGAVTRLLAVPDDRLTGQTPLVELGIDDETGLEVLVVVEDALDVRFPDDFLEGLHTYGDLTIAVRRAVGG